ncbi:MAG: hypothetical protein ABJO01_05865 [Parasphingorhabdus sp.]|uniref:hypothetical protein n=1 Tax=Parasphingorhabdus sp. TaxID=2709688 RepID=UPI00329926A8
MSPATAARSMRIIGVISIITAIFFALAGVNDFTGANNIFFAIASSGTDGVAGLNTPEAKLAMAIAGGLFGGVGAFYLFVSAPGVEQGNERIRKGSIYAFLTWFIIDSSASVASGNAVNIIPNLGFLFIYLLPLTVVKQPRTTASA